jgi:poly(hydroxyalkanoate) granule-associated protein
MATKPRQPAADAAPAPHADAPAAASAHNVWLAGLGALASAQAEGSKAFEALVKQGVEMQSKTQALAKERMAEAAQRMEAISAQAGGGAGVAPWGRLGGIFEDRVAQALAGLGMPTAQELAALAARVEALERALGQPPAAPTAPRARTRKRG